MLLTVEYDGAHFHGWQEQPGLSTVQGTLQDALARIVRHEVVVRGAGRTDAGVHAWAQRASVYTTSDAPLPKIARGVSGIGRGRVAVTEAREVPLEFDPRRDACGKVYAYRLLVRSEPSPLLEGRVWHVRPPFDVARLRRELATLLGRADWSAYRSADCGSPDPVKTLHRAEVEQQGDLVTIRFQGSGFLKQMVRILVGTAVDVGKGRRPEGHMLEVRAKHERRLAGETAPGRGLFLERVLYPDGLL